MLSDIPLAPADPILGIAEAFQKDLRPDKVNLGVGLFQDEDGRTPVLPSVKEAERRLLATETTKTYLPIDGHRQLAAEVERLLFGEGHPVHGHAATSHTPGGTGALRVIADFLRQHRPQATVWLSEPTWENHAAVFEAAGLRTARYAYYHAGEQRVDGDRVLGALRGIAAGDAVLLHGCCHNPTGCDPALDLWRDVLAVLAERAALPIVDLAYLGFSDNTELDAGLVRLCAQTQSAFVVCTSFSKNMGLYRERVGALTLVTENPATTAAVQSQIKRTIRRLYSNPPAHGGEIARTILTDPTLRQQWFAEVAAMRARLHATRDLLGRGLDAHGVSLSPRGNGFLREQHGMFTLTGLQALAVDALRRDHGVYLVGSGRINVVGITQANVDRVCAAIARVSSGP